MLIIIMCSYWYLHDLDVLHVFMNSEVMTQQGIFKHILGCVWSSFS